jgi:hypothetical protein
VTSLRTRGAPGTQDVSIDGTCDDEACIWEARNPGALQAPEPAASEPAPAPSPPASGLDEIRQRLEGAGYRVVEENGGLDPGGVGGLVVIEGELNVHFTLFDEDTAAARSEGAFQQLAQEMPDQIAAGREGPVLYYGTIEEPALLPKDQYDSIVATALG